MKVETTVLDTSIYIPYLRGEAYSELVERGGRSGRVRLNAVVLGELYAGTRSTRDKSDLDALGRAYRSIGFLVTPTEEDWSLAGQAIRRMSRLYGRIDPRVHLNDVLILASSGRIGAVVLTENAAPFARWAALLHRMGRKARLRAVTRSDHLG